MKKLFILILLISSFLTACMDDQEPSLPAATTEGLNTAGCYVDEKLWYARTEPSSFNDLQKIDGGSITDLNGDLSYNTTYFWMWMSDRINKNSITIYIKEKPLINKVYECNISTNARPAYLEFINYCSYSGSEGHFMTDENATGTVTFTRADSALGLYAGNFQFKGFDKRTGKQITITEGRFDYNQINPE